MTLRQPGHPVHLALGLTVWSLWFVVVYGGVSLACAGPGAEAGGFGLPGVRVVLLAFTGLTALALGLAARWCWRGARHLASTPGPLMGDARFVAHMSAWLYALAAGSAVFVGLPLLVVPACV